MLGRKTSTVNAALLLLMAMGASAQTEWFPLNQGNQWVYRLAGRFGKPENIVLEVAGSQQAGDQTYTVVKGLPTGNVLLRAGGDGKMYVWNSEAKQETLWLDFSAPQDSTFPGGAGEPCTGQARVAARNASYKGPVGASDRALVVAYTPTCADAGITEDVFLPYIGLVRRTSTSIAGPVVMELSYTRLGGVTVLSDKEVSFLLSLDKPVYTLGTDTSLTARFALRTTFEKPLTLTFPSGQTFDLAIRNDKGETVSQWSTGMAFTQAVRTEDFGPGEKNWVVTVLLQNGNGPLPPGKYQAEAWLTAAQGKTYSASAGFERRR